MIALYNVISEDEFIARKDGQEDFIPDELWPTTLAILNSYDFLLMGSKTYETIQDYERESLRLFEELEVEKIVISKDFFVKSGYKVIRSLQEIPEGKTIVSSGPTLNNSLFQEKLIEKVILHIVPVEIGNGISLFSEEVKEKLQLQSEKTIDGGIKQVEYGVKY